MFAFEADVCFDVVLFLVFAIPGVHGFVLVYAP